MTLAPASAIANLLPSGESEMPHNLAESHYIAGNINGVTVQDFSGDGFPDIAVASTGSTVAILLNQPGGKLTAGTLALQPEPSTFTKLFSMTLNIKPLTAASGTPTGTVTFSIDGVPVGTATLNGSAASFTYQAPSLAVEAHAVAAVYSGDATFVPAYFTAQHQVIPILNPTSIALTGKPTSVLAGQTVSFRAVVSSTGPAPYGMASFLDGTTPIGAVALDTNSVAVFDTALLSAGTHTITAKYLGNANFAPVISSPVTVVVNGLQTSTTLTANPTSVPVGGNVLLTATVRSPNGTPTGSVIFYDGTSLLAEHSA